MPATAGAAEDAPPVRRARSRAGSPGSPRAELLRQAVATLFRRAGSKCAPPAGRLAARRKVRFTLIDSSAEAGPKHRQTTTPDGTALHIGADTCRTPGPRADWSTAWSQRLTVAGDISKARALPSTPPRAERPLEPILWALRAPIKWGPGAYGPWRVQGGALAEREAAPRYRHQQLEVGDPGKQPPAQQLGFGDAHLAKMHDGAGAALGQPADVGGDDWWRFSGTPRWLAVPHQHDRLAVAGHLDGAGHHAVGNDVEPLGVGQHRTGQPVAEPVDLLAHLEQRTARPRSLRARSSRPAARALPGSGPNTWGCCGMPSAARRGRWRTPAGQEIAGLQRPPMQSADTGAQVRRQCCRVRLAGRCRRRSPGSPTRRRRSLPPAGSLPPRWSRCAGPAARGPRCAA